MAITKDQIFQAADQLTAGGSTATLANVRKALGGGSYTTINEALKEWKARQQASTTPIREPAPAAVAARTEELGADIWAIALELANARLTHEREALEATRAQLETAQQEATELADQLSAELETLQAQHQQATDALQGANSALGQLRQDNAALSRQLATTEARAGETTKRVDDLKAELQHAHAGNQALQVRLNTAGEALNDKSAHLVRLQLELTHTEDRAETTRQQLIDGIERLGERLTQAEAERGQAQQAASTAREEAARLRGELEAIRVQNAALLEALKPHAPAVAPVTAPKASKPKTPKAPKP